MMSRLVYPRIVVYFKKHTVNINEKIFKIVLDNCLKLLYDKNVPKIRDRLCPIL